MTLSIVIVNWNGKDLIGKCIESIFSTVTERLKDHDYEIIVIDNASTDGSIEYLTGLTNKITLIRNKENTGYAPAANQGMKLASGKYVLLLGSDTVVLKDALIKCTEFLSRRTECGAVGCKLLNPDGTIQNNCKKFPTLLNGFFTYLSLNRLNRSYDMSRFKYDKTTEVEQISTTFLMFRKDLLEKLNFFNEEYKILYNDVDLCKRIWESGHKIVFLHETQIIHYGSRSTQKAGFSVRKIMYKDIYRYYRNNFGIWSIILIPVLFIRLFVVSTSKS
jgi:GT2 family glycosyltransferase